MKGRRTGFSLTELLIVLTLLSLLGAGFWWVRWTPTARREAEQAMGWLYSVLAQADRSGVSFALSVETGAHPGLVAVWGDSATEAERWDTGCALKRLASAGGPAAILYSPQWGTFTPALTLEITGKKGDVCFLILSGQGRVRISDLPPE